MNCPVASLHISSYLVERRHRPSTEHILRAAAHHTTRAAETARLSDRGSGARCSCRRRRAGVRCSTPGIPARVEV